jgi:hypothetical protein
MPTRIPVSLASAYAARAAVEALILAMESELGVGEQQEPGKCPHCGAPAEQQENRDTLAGTSERWCKVCRREWEP